MRRAVRADPAAVHALGVERHRHAAVRAQDDRAAVAAHLRYFLVDHRLADLLRGFVQLGHAQADLACSGNADVVLAPARAGYRTGSVGVGTRADDRRIADTAVLLVGHAAGRGAGGKPALAVAGERADRAEVLERHQPFAQRYTSRVVPCWRVP